MRIDEELENIEKKVHYLLGKNGFTQPDVADYSAERMRHYYAAKRRYQQKFDLYHAEIAAGRIEI